MCLTESFVAFWKTSNLTLNFQSSLTSCPQNSLRYLHNYNFISYIYFGLCTDILYEILIHMK
jgi:hypothetical protein